MEKNTNSFGKLEKNTNFKMFFFLFKLFKTYKNVLLQYRHNPANADKPIRVG